MPHLAGSMRSLFTKVDNTVKTGFKLNLVGESATPAATPVVEEEKKVQPYNQHHFISSLTLPAGGSLFSLLLYSCKLIETPKL